VKENKSNNQIVAEYHRNKANNHSKAAHDARAKLDHHDELACKHHAIADECEAKHAAEEAEKQNANVTAEKMKLHLFAFVFPKAWRHVRQLLDANKIGMDQFVSFVLNEKGATLTTKSGKVEWFVGSRGFTSILFTLTNGERAEITEGINDSPEDVIDLLLASAIIGGR